MKKNGRKIIATLLLTALIPMTTMGFLQRVSVDSNGIQGNEFSSRPSISENGRFIAFNSASNNLVENHVNSWNDQWGNFMQVNNVFLHDTQTQSTILISKTMPQVYTGTYTGWVNSGQTYTETTYPPANNYSENPSISADGKFIAFESRATNITTWSWFSGNNNPPTQIFLYDVDNDYLEVISLNSSGNISNEDAYNPRISGNGQFVSFTSLANNLVPNDNNNTWDIFVYDRINKTIERVSVNENGEEWNGWSAGWSLSHDGQFVAFWSSADNLVANDTNGVWDVFVYDRVNQTIERISVNNNGDQGNGRSPQGAGTDISGDGRFVIFSSDASNLVPNDTNDINDTFIYDRQNNSIRRISVDNNGNQTVGIPWFGIGSYNALLSYDGTTALFTSNAGTLVPDDTNGAYDAFTYDYETETIKRISVTRSGDQAVDSDFSMPISLSPDGCYASYASISSILVPNDTNATADVFVASLCVDQPSLWTAETLPTNILTGSWDDINGVTLEVELEWNSYYLWQDPELNIDNLWWWTLTLPNQLQVWEYEVTIVNANPVDSKTTNSPLNIIDENQENEEDEEENNEETSNTAGGGGWWSTPQDYCPDGDFSESYYDGICDTENIHNIPDRTDNRNNEDEKKQIETNSMTCDISQELIEAFTFSYDLGITTVSDICKADIYWPLIRKHMAKFLSVFAMKVLDIQPDTERICNFTDMDEESVEMQVFAKISCQLGIMGLKKDGTPDTVFNPNERVTRAMFGTALSRLIYGTKNNIDQNDPRKRYQEHLNNLKIDEIITQINNPNSPEVRGYAMLMLQRTKQRLQNR